MIDSETPAASSATNPSPPQGMLPRRRPSTPRPNSGHSTSPAYLHPHPLPASQSSLALNPPLWSGIRAVTSPELSSADNMFSPAEKMLQTLWGGESTLSGLGPPLRCHSQIRCQVSATARTTTLVLPGCSALKSGSSYPPFLAPLFFKLCCLYLQWTPLPGFAVRTSVGPRMSKGDGPSGH